MPDKIINQQQYPYDNLSDLIKKYGFAEGYQEPKYYSYNERKPKEKKIRKCTRCFIELETKSINEPYICSSCYWKEYWDVYNAN